MKTHHYKRNRNCILSLLTIAALLATFAIPAFALEENPPKEEVVYVNLLEDGSVDEIYVVNSFELNKEGQIIDYGNYTAFREMTASGGMQVKKEKITIDAKAGKLYYEGTLKSRSIPWAFTIQYFIDKKEYPAHRMAGKSGALEIKIKVRPASKKNNPFFDNFTLQASLLLDTSICKNIQAKDATIANAGKNKQLAFMVLPGKEADFSVTADVVDFEMEAISINALSMDMSLDFDEGAMFGSKLTELKDGLADLDDGAQELMDGTKELTEGTGELRDGVKDLDEAVVEMKDGTAEFVDGIKDLRKASRDLDRGVRDLRKGTSALADGSGDMLNGMNGLVSGASQLSGGISQVKDGLTQLVTGAAIVNNGLIGLSGGLDQLASENPALTAGALQIFQSMLDEASAQLNAAGLAVALTPGNYAASLDGIVDGLVAADPADPRITTIGALKTQLDGYNSFYKGLVDYTDGVAQASLGLASLKGGTQGLYDGLVTLKGDGIEGLILGIGGLENGIISIRDGTIDLREGVLDLHEGVVELKDGTAKLADGVIDLEDGIIELNDGVIELSDGIITLLDGAVELHEGTVELYDGTVTLAEGTLEFRDKTATIEKDMKDMIKDKIKEMMGGNFNPISFVSEKNTNVTSVQFVMQTQSITKPVVEKNISDETPKRSIWQRLLALFGF